MRRREGEAVLGLWLPLAFATLVQCVIGIGGQPPKRSELLESWCLVELAKAVKLDEDAEQAEALGKWVEGFEKRFGRNGGEIDRHQAESERG